MFKILFLYAYAYKKLLDQAGLVALGTDFPVEQVSTFLTFYAAVARKDTENYPEGGYIKGGYPTDGWENELQFVSPGSEGRPYDLFSLGADGQQGGEGQDADLYAQL